MAVHNDHRIGSIVARSWAAVAAVAVLIGGVMPPSSVRADSDTATTITPTVEQTEATVTSPGADASDTTTDSATSDSQGTEADSSDTATDSTTSDSASEPDSAVLDESTPSAGDDSHARGAGDSQYLTVTKTVDDDTPQRGDSFTYTIAVSCAEASCLDAELSDLLPALLDGYVVQNVTATPSSVLPVVTWEEAGVPTGQPSVIGAETAVHVGFNQLTDAPAGKGLESGSTFNLTLTLKVPDFLAPDTYVIDNTAATTASNSADDSSTATITVVVPVVLDVLASKTWTPTPQTFDPGTPSTVTLGATNNSNIAVDTLVIQEPATALEDAASLDPSNPFTITDFTGFGISTLPLGATTVRVDAYVFDSGTSHWGWVVGAPASAPALPIGVNAADVGGLRFTYTAPAAIEIGASATISFYLQQRATTRDSDEDLSTSSHTVDNVARASVTSGALDPVTDDALARYAVNPAKLVVNAFKDITPDRISAGDSAVATISATNGSDIGVNEFGLADLDYFTANITFGGFTSAPTWPSGATSATVNYYLLSGPPFESVTFAVGAIPVDPSGPISGFEIVYTASGGGIAADAATAATFTITTNEGATGEAVELVTTNTVTATILAPNGLGDTHDASDTLTVVKPGLDIELTKTILPSTPVKPGDAVVTSLVTKLTTTSDYVKGTQIVVEDAWDGTPGDFWDAFNLSEIAPTQVPANTTLTVEVRTGVGVGTWSTLITVPSTGSPSLLSLTSAQLTALLTTTAITDVTGVRFTFDKPTGFASATTVAPYIVTTARGQLRSGGAVTSSPDSPVTYTNAATAAGVGATETGTKLADDDQDSDDAQIITRAGAGVVGIDKVWNSAAVAAQSGQQRTTALNWSVAKGYSTVAITDPMDPTLATSPEQTVFQAFDLRALEAIGANSVPFTNGWYLRYDTITSIQLYGSGGWTTVSAPVGGWIANGAFVGYVLNTTEVADTTGVRINLAENEDARDAAQQIGANYDPYAPRSGTGVAASSGSRTFVLDWQIRDKARVGGAWVTSKNIYNTSDRGIVDNSVGLAATSAGGPVIASGNDTIMIVDAPPLVSVTKSVVAANPTYVPYPGTMPADNYPTATYTLTAKNGSVARASYVRVTDPPACADSAPVGDCASPATPSGANADPFIGGTDWLNPSGSSANPFERYDLTGLTIAATMPAEVDLAASTVWLLRYDPVDGYSTTATTAAAANLLSAAALADVVGVSVTFQNTDPATTGGTITNANNLTVTMNARLRTTLRSSGATQQLGAGETKIVTNRVVAQTYDPVLNDGKVAADVTSVDITLTGGVIDVTPTKSISTSTITEPQRKQTITVTIGANQGLSTLSPSKVRVRDDIVSSPEFWDRFELTGLGTIQAPAGADRVTVAALYGPDGFEEWISDGPSTIGAAALPAAATDRSLVKGIEFTYTRDDGAFFSPALPAPKWSTTAPFTAELRDNYRSTDEPITFDEDFVVVNTVTAQSSRPTEASEEKTTTASVTLTPGSRELSVSKLTNGGNRFATVGTLVPFDLTFRNSGTGFLTIEELRDTLPPTLLYPGVPAPVATPDPTGLLPAEVTVTQVGQEVVFTWPADDRTMAPGETYNIRIWLELQPVAAGEKAINTMTVSTTETLGSCGHMGSGTLTDAFDRDPTTCGTTDSVTPSTGANLFTVKGVSGSLPGAFVPGSPASTCSPTLAGSYYRTPCVANSVIGGTDKWVLRVVNAGTIPVTQMTVFDQLPVAGDKFLVSGASRKSAYRPQVVAGSLQVSAPADVTWTVEVTSSSGVCAGTWGGLTGQTPCAQNGETWGAAESIPWSQVSGLRITFDFSKTPTGTLSSAQGVDVRYSTLNVAATPSDPSGASTVVPAADQYAWNQFGVKYRNQNSTTSLKIAPNVVGVHLLTGPIQIDKVVIGEGADYAPAAFVVDVSCSIGETPLQLGTAAMVTLNSDNGYSARIDGIPVGAKCTVEEQGPLGAFGETGRQGSPTVLAVELPAGPDDDVPAAQISTITNEYKMSQLTVTKRIDTNAIGAELGPFAFTLSCTTLLGTKVDFGDGTELSFTLAGGATYSTQPGSIPIGSVCTIAETDNGKADSVTITGAGVTDLRNGTATARVGVETAAVVVANGFDAGQLVVAKDVSGAGAALYGSGPFGFTAVCTYNEQTVLNAGFSLVGGERRSFGPYPAGTKCVVAEVDNAGAVASQLDPSSGLATISKNGPVTVTATNVFDVTSITVTKEIVGKPPTADVAFTVSLSCTVLRNGAVVPVSIPGGPDRQLVAPGGLSATYGNLPTNATCTFTETQRGGAEVTTIEIDGVSAGAGSSATLTTPRSGATSVKIRVVNKFSDNSTTTTTTTVDGSGSTTTIVDGSGGVPGDKNGSGGGSLPTTGSNIADILVASLAAALLGLALLATRRRTSHTPNPAE